MTIRKATIDDIDNILDTYLAAKRFMRTTGNCSQWIDDYPSRELILDSIGQQKHYVCTCADQIAGTFYFSVERDVTYGKIYGGEWLDDSPYGVVHRLASNGKYKGVAHSCLQWCFGQCGNVRIDTHRDNTVMQNILKKEGYLQCGIIFLLNGDERLAFQKC